MFVVNPKLLCPASFDLFNWLRRLILTALNESVCCETNHFVHRKNLTHVLSDVSQERLEL